MATSENLKFEFSIKYSTLTICKKVLHQLNFDSGYNYIYINYKKNLIYSLQILGPAQFMSQVLYTIYSLQLVLQQY